MVCRFLRGSPLCNAATLTPPLRLSLSAHVPFLRRTARVVLFGPGGSPAVFLVFLLAFVDPLAFSIDLFRCEHSFKAPHLLCAP